MSLPKPIEQALEATGLPWSIEAGGKHLKLRVNGRLAGILSRGSKRESDQRAVRNTVAQIRRAARGY